MAYKLMAYIKEDAMRNTREEFDRIAQELGGAGAREGGLKRMLVRLPSPGRLALALAFILASATVYWFGLPLLGKIAAGPSGSSAAEVSMSAAQAPSPAQFASPFADMEETSVEIEEVPAEWRDALRTLCARVRDAEPSTLLADMRSGQTLVQRFRAPIAEEGLEAALGQFMQLCAAVEAEQAAVSVTTRFERRIADIEARVARIEADACGPRFDVNWSYHIGRLVNWGEDGSADIGPNRFVRVVSQLEAGLSYYEDMAVDTCAMHARKEAAIRELDERLEYDRSRQSVREALKTVREMPSTAEVHRLVRPAVVRELEAEKARLRSIRNGSITDAILRQTGLAMLENIGYIEHLTNLRLEAPRLQETLTAVCTDRLTKTANVGMRLFTEALPGWSNMNSARKSYYRRLYDRLTGRDNSDARVALNAGMLCAEEDTSTLWALMEGIIDDEYQRDKQTVDESFRDEYAREYGLQTYVGSRLQNEVYLQRVYDLEYDDYRVGPDRLGGEDLPVPLRTYIRELTEQYREILERDKDRALEMAKADLNATTQIEKATMQAKRELEVARLQARREREVALIKQQTELLKIRELAAQKPAFMSQVLGAMAPALGGGLAKGVLDNWLFPSQPTPTTE